MGGLGLGDVDWLSFFKRIRGAEDDGIGGIEAAEDFDGVAEITSDRDWAQIYFAIFVHDPDPCGLARFRWTRDPHRSRLTPSTPTHTMQVERLSLCIEFFVPIVAIFFSSACSLVTRLSLLNPR